MKRQKRLTRRQRKDDTKPAPRAAAGGGGAHGHHGHIHCVACGKHLDVEVFGEPDGAMFTRCDHGTDHPHCVGCTDRARELIREHDEKNAPIRATPAWH